MSSQIVVGAAMVAVAWLAICLLRPRFAIRVLLIWVPFQGWVQLNVLQDANWSVVLYELQMAVVYLSILVQTVTARDGWPVPSVMRFALPFVVWFVVLVPFSLPSTGLLLVLISLRTYVFPFLMVWVGYRAFRSRSDMASFGTLLMAQMVVIAVVTAIQFQSWVSPTGEIVAVPKGFNIAGTLRPPGTFSSPAHLGMYLLAMIPLGIGFLNIADGRWQRRLIVAGLLGTAAALAVNSQRSTLMQLFVALPLLFILARRLTPRTALKGLLFAGIVFGAGFALTGNAFLGRVLSIRDNLAFALVEAPLLRLKDGLQTPILGQGLAAALPGVARFQVTSANPAESFMAALVFQTGVPGMVFFYVFLGALLSHGLRALRRCKSRDMKLMAAAIVSYEVAIWLQSWTYDPLHYPPSRVVFWFWAGALLAMPRWSEALTADASTVGAQAEVAPAAT